MSFQPGDLLVCVANNVDNPVWKGIKPIIGEYYTWRRNYESGKYGYVEEIISPISPTSGIEYAHGAFWYKKVEVDISEVVEVLENQLVNS